MGNANKKKVLFVFCVRETFIQKSGKFVILSGDGLRIWHWAAYPSCRILANVQTPIVNKKILI